MKRCVDCGVEGNRWRCRVCASTASAASRSRLIRKKRKPYISGRVAYIPLTRGKIAKVDLRDLPSVSKYLWYAQSNKSGDIWYARSSDGMHLMHTLILPLPKPFTVDHIDGNGLNNRRKNIRKATRSQQKQNQWRRNDHSSKYKGVSWHPGHRSNSSPARWRASIKVNGKVKMRSAESEIEAAIMYNAMARKYFGKFARPNKI
jgi:hypothetical protein